MSEILPVESPASLRGTRWTLTSRTLVRALMLVTLLGPATFGASASAQIPDAEYAARRDALLERVNRGAIVAFGARQVTNHWPPFYQVPAFRYLTGFLEPDAVLVMVRDGARTASTLFVERPDARRALYDGERASVEAVERAMGIQGRYSDDLEHYLDSLATAGMPLYSIADFQSNEFSARDSTSTGRLFLRRIQAAHPGLEIREVNGWVDELRARKSEAEQALLQTSAEISSRAVETAMKAIQPGVTENEIQALIEYEFRTRGADRPGYSSIVGSGPYSTVLHYPAGTREMKSGEVVLMDVGSYYQGYSADITRTIPVDRTFRPEHRDVYEVVLAAQKAAESAIGHGVDRAAPGDAAYRVLKDGMVRLGLIESVDATFDAPPGLCPGGWATVDGCPQWYLYAYHGFFHGIGLDVHDPSSFQSVRPYTFQPGDVFTIEPGLYVREDVFDDLPDTPRNRAMITHAQAAAARYRNVGVRIEDDYALTADGLVRLTDAPREIEEIEALRARPATN
jgi:Xaa-Pro aminopeptidase